MKYLKMIGLAAATVAALSAFVGTASATTLTIKGEKQSNQLAIDATLKSGTSLILKDKNGTTNDTCTGASLVGATTSPFSATTISGHVSTLDFTGCNHTTTVLNNGTLSVTWTSGSNGTVSSAGAEVTFKSTVFGVSAFCKTGTGTTIGTLTGTSSGSAIIDINAPTVDCGALGTSSWMGEYVVTSPQALGATS